MESSRKRKKSIKLQKIIGKGQDCASKVKTKNQSGKPQRREFFASKELKATNPE